MLQRIQTLFLLLAAGLTAALFALPPWRGGGVPSCAAPDAVMWAIQALATAGLLFTLFSYRRRTRQMRLCLWNALLLAALQGWIVYRVLTTGSVFFVTAAFPLVAAALTLVAWRYIRRDEAMVRAADRLR
jgi:hypothetical protein